MVMIPLDNFSRLRRTVVKAVQVTVGPRGGAGEDAAKRVRRPAAGPAPAERHRIAENLHKLVEARRTLAVGRAAAAEEPDMREDKLAEVRDRLARGYYNSTEVRDKVAGGVDQVIEGMKKL